MWTWVLKGVFQNLWVLGNYRKTKMRKKVKNKYLYLIVDRLMQWCLINCAQILAAQGHALCWNVMAADELHNNGPQDLIMVSQWIKMAIDKMQLCLLSIAYAWPYHNTTMGQCSQCWHQQTARPHDAIHTLCHVQLKLQIIHISSMPVAIEGEHLPTEVGYDV